jgi:hypothetical protein
MSQEIKIAIISAVSAIIGALISQSTTFLLSWIDKRHQKKILLRQKYEEMLYYFQDSLVYIQEVHKCRKRDQLFQLTHSPPAGRALGLSQLYFQEFVEPLTKYIVLQNAFYNSAVSIFNDDIPLNVGGQCIKHSAHGEKIANLMIIKNDLIDLFSHQAKKYT